jgi:hypothetical protein
MPTLEAPMQAALALSASASVTATALSLSISLRNTGSKPIAVFNRPWDSETYKVPAEVGTRFSQVSLGNDGIVTLGMIVPRTPAGRGVERMIVPCVTVIEPGQEFKDAAQLPLPLEEFNPYFPAKTSPVTTVSSPAVAIAADYVEIGGDITITSGPVPGCREARGFTRSTIERARYVISASVPVLRRADEFK